MKGTFQNDENSNADCAATQAARRPRQRKQPAPPIYSFAQVMGSEATKPPPDLILAIIGYDEPIGRRFPISEPHRRQSGLAERDQHVYAFEFDDFTRDRLCFLATKNPLHFKHRSALN